MLAFERRWAEAVLGGFATPGAPGLAPRPDEVDWVRGVTRFLARASTKGRLGVRVGLFLVVTAPLWCWGQLRTALSLSAEERARLLDELLAHRWFAVRELCLLLKLVACMTLFGVPAVRARSGYDPAPTPAFAPARRLAVIAQTPDAPMVHEEVA